jgi:uncharacterized YigZ family protein
MLCVTTTSIIEDSIKKSRFIGLTIPCKSVDEVSQQLEQLHHQHPHASHIVFAYRIKSGQRIIIKFHDAGEPSGTAGKPIYQHLEGKNLINLLVVIIRYFGGIKLGAGGLTRAYSNTARKVIENSDFTEYIEYLQINLELHYKQMQPFEYQLKKVNGRIIQQNFSEKIVLLIELPKKNFHFLAESFKRIHFKVL